MSYNITVLGLGFVGLTTALGFAEKGCKVYGFDVDSKKSDLIKSGRLPFAEPGLCKALERNLGGKFEVTDSPAEAAKRSDFIFICVGTPKTKSGSADLRYIRSALDMSVKHFGDEKFRVVVIKSTVPPSTTSQNIIPYLEGKGFTVGKDLGVANNPEFLREGTCWNDFMEPDRIVCGICDDRSLDMLKELYTQFNAPFHSVSLNTGEFVKYLSNAFLAVLISFSNEMSIIADTIGDIELKEAFNILHEDRRWKGCGMAAYAYPGCGYGGYCLPKDTEALYSKSSEKGFKPEILHGVIITNEKMPEFIVKKIKQTAAHDEKIGILGLSFKPGSDDVRNCASAKIIDLLLKSGYSNILAYDPVAAQQFKEKFNFTQINYTKTLEEICKKSDVLVVATAWKEFFHVAEKYPEKRIVDARYCLCNRQSSKGDCGNTVSNNRCSQNCE